jgi:hypothetical protein
MTNKKKKPSFDDMEAFINQDKEPKNKSIKKEPAKKQKATAGKKTEKKPAGRPKSKYLSEKEMLVGFPKDIHTELKIASVKKGVPMKELIVEAVIEYIKQ